MGARVRRRLQADARTRTGDPLLTMEVLYQLSYVGSGKGNASSPALRTHDLITCAHAGGSS
jgi:hypothetical protein